jgi:hypothetical protein
LNRCVLVVAELFWTEIIVSPAIVPSATSTIIITIIAEPRSLGLPPLRTIPGYCTRRRVAQRTVNGNLNVNVNPAMFVYVGVQVSVYE